VTVGKVVGWVGGHLGPLWEQGHDGPGKGRPDGDFSRK
jgi:hypothetical protein